MKESIESIRNSINKKDIEDKKEILALFKLTLNKLIKNKIDNFIGDYPSFLEPVYLEDNIKIEDDVLLGPKVYIGSNCSIGEFSELSNCIVFENVKIGEGFKLDNCIIAEGSSLNFSNLNLKNCLIRGSGSSKEQIEVIKLI
jgi:NDP-sugar pyrophosphorylase family protein